MHCWSFLDSGEQFGAGKSCPQLDLKSPSNTETTCSFASCPPRIYISTLNRALAEGPGADQTSCSMSQVDELGDLSEVESADRRAFCSFRIAQPWRMRKVSLLQAVNRRHLEAKRWDL